MVVTIVDWLQHDREPADLYELLGEARFEPSRRRLLGAARACYAKLLPYECHSDTRIAGRAMELLRRLAEADYILRDPAKLRAHHRAILEYLRTAYARAGGDRFTPTELAEWLRQQSIHPDRIEIVARMLAAPPEEPQSFSLAPTQQYDTPSAGEPSEDSFLQELEPTEEGLHKVRPMRVTVPCTGRNETFSPEEQVSSARAEYSSEPAPYAATSGRAPGESAAVVVGRAVAAAVGGTATAVAKGTVVAAKTVSIAGGVVVGVVGGVVVGVPVITVKALGGALRWAHSRLPRASADPGDGSEALDVLGPRRGCALGKAARVLARLVSRVVSFVARSSPRDRVACSVFSPPAVTQGQAILVQVFAYLPHQAKQAARQASEADSETGHRARKSLEIRIPRGQRLEFHLRIPRLQIDNPVASLVWQGEPESVQFEVSSPADCLPGSAIASVTVTLDSVPIGHVKFKLSVLCAGSPLPSAEPEHLGDAARRYKLAFISYASADREEVMRRVQMLRPLRIKFFQDLLHLDPGDRWKKRLHSYVKRCDLFLLFWSSSAKASKWVMEEVRWAMERKCGDDLNPPEIVPVVIEGPPPVQPPEELAHLHFNDPLLYFMHPQSQGSV